MPEYKPVLIELTPISFRQWGTPPATKVCVYPESRLVSIDRNRLFSCKGSMYPMNQGGNPNWWRNILRGTTHIWLTRDEEPLIFFTRCDGIKAEFNITSAQPYGVWAKLNPVPMQPVLRLQRFGHELHQMRLKILAWATISHSRLGSNVDRWLHALSNNTDLMRMIILQALKHR